jgi:hypothetical protein
MFSCDLILPKCVSATSLKKIEKNITPRGTVMTIIEREIVILPCHRFWSQD